jgi:hypothetical protein
MKKTLLSLTLIVLILALGGVIYWQYKNTATRNAPSVSPQNKTANWQTYLNKKFGYSIDYPGDWIFRKFPDTQTGAGFRPLNSPAEIASECITVDERGTAGNEYNTPFDEYVKKAAIVEIQDYETLNSIKSVTTTAGLVGYETMWIYKTMDGQEKTSLPITYFENEKIVKAENSQLKYKTVQIILNDENCEETYNQMLFTLKLLE